MDQDRHSDMTENAIPGLFSNMFGELLLDRDCATIEDDLNADPMEKEICQTFRQFNEGLRQFHVREQPSRGDDIEGQPGRPEDTDPQSLKDSILSPPPPPPPPDRLSPAHGRPQRDRNLDRHVEANPSLLDEYLEGHNSVRPQVRSHSSYSSVVISRRPDGSYEEKRTVRGSDGSEEVTVTYSDGQETRREVHRRDKEGRQSSESTVVSEENPGIMNRLSDWIWGR